MKSILVFYADPFFVSFNSRCCSPENSTLLPHRAASRLSKRPTAVVSNHSVLPSGHSSVVPCYEVSCYHSRLGSLIGNLFCTLLLWALLPSLCVNASEYLIKCAECWILLHRLQVSVTALLKNPSRLSSKSSNVQEQSLRSSRLPQEMQRRSLGQTHTSSWDSISSKNLLVRRICCFHH
jgi:hypothetical protein